MPKITAPKKLKITIALDALVLSALDKAVANLPGISRSEYVNQCMAMVLIDKGFIETISNSLGGTDSHPGAANTRALEFCDISPAPNPSPAHADSCIERASRARVRVRIEENYDV